MVSMKTSRTRPNHWEVHDDFEVLLKWKHQTSPVLKTKKARERSHSLNCPQQVRREIYYTSHYHHHRRLLANPINPRIIIIPSSTTTFSSSFLSDDERKQTHISIIINRQNKNLMVLQVQVITLVSQSNNNNKPNPKSISVVGEWPEKSQSSHQPVEHQWNKKRLYLNICLNMTVICPWVDWRGRVLSPDGFGVSTKI